MKYEDYKFLVAKWGQERTDKTFDKSIAAMVRSIKKKYEQNLQ